MRCCIDHEWLDDPVKREGKIAKPPAPAGKGGAPAGSLVRVDVKVSGSSGRVLSAKSVKAPNSTIGSCAASAVKKSAKFARFKAPTQTFSVAFKL